MMKLRIAMQLLDVWCHAVAPLSLRLLHAGCLMCNGLSILSEVQ